MTRAFEDAMQAKRKEKIAAAMKEARRKSQERQEDALNAVKGGKRIPAFKERQWVSYDFELALVTKLDLLDNTAKIMYEFDYFLFVVRDHAHIIIKYHTFLAEQLQFLVRTITATPMFITLRNIGTKSWTPSMLANATSPKSPSLIGASI